MRHITAMIQYRQLRPGTKMGRLGPFGRFVAMALGLAFAIALVVLGLALALVLVPVVAAGLLVGLWRIRSLRACARTGADAARRRDGEAPRTIETDYTVVKSDNQRL